jgi:glycosyltransferase involved in cell wall biosynthesis
MDVSIVMSTRNRGECVVPAVTSVLRDQRCSWEVILVDQSTDDATERALAEAGLLSDPHLVYHRTSTRGVSHGRNVGIGLARGEVIAITDDDCVVPKGWAGAYLARFRAAPELSMIFASIHAADGMGEGWIPTYEPLVVGPIRPSIEITRSLGLSANMAVRRSAFRTIAPFDELLGPGTAFGGGEDTDIGYRALRMGLGVYAADEPAVVHYGIRRGGAISAHGSLYLRGMALMHLKHARCGDLDMLLPIGRELLRWSRQALGHLVRGRRPSGLRAVAGLLGGIAASFRCDVGREHRLYRPWRRRQACRVLGD